MKKQAVMKYLNKFIFLIGIFFLSQFLHEFFHYLDCGGEFVAGAYWNGYARDLIVGTTWCARELKWGEWPTVIEVAIDLYGLLSLKRVI